MSLWFCWGLCMQVCVWRGGGHVGSNYKVLLLTNGLRGGRWVRGGGRGSRSLCSWQSALICYNGGWVPGAAAPNNYKHTHASLARRYTLINANVTLKFTHLLLSPVVQQRQEHEFEGSSVNSQHIQRGKRWNTAPCLQRTALLTAFPTCWHQAQVWDALVCWPPTHCWRARCQWLSWLWWAPAATRPSPGIELWTGACQGSCGYLSTRCKSEPRDSDWPSLGLTDNITQDRQIHQIAVVFEEQRFPVWNSLWASQSAQRPFPRILLMVCRAMASVWLVRRDWKHKTTTDQTRSE